MTPEPSLVRRCEFSPDRAYRYTLWRQWGTCELADLFSLPPPQHSTAAYAMFMGLNPSTADEVEDDPTIRRCMDFARRWGYCEMVMTNLFAFRATDPDVMKRLAGGEAIGPENDEWLIHLAAGAGIIVAAWGKNGAHRGRAAEVMKFLPTLHYLRLNNDGSPEHPLYIPAVTVPVLWRIEDRE